MKKALSVVLLSLTLCSGLNAQEWPIIKTETRPGSRWWWLGSAIDKDNLKYNIMEYAKAGLGEMELTPIYGVQGNESNDITFLSEKWLDILRFTEDEIRRNGMTLSMTTGTGWPFGGPEVTLDDAATQAVFQTYKLNGGQNITLNISVKDEKQRPVAHLDKVMAYRNGRSKDITELVTNDTLHWNVPSGEWDVVALYIGKRLIKVERAAPGGEGYVIDHFSKSAVQHYLSKFDKAFKESGTPFPYTFFNDSYEVHRADWTPGFLDEFAKRRGYRLEKHFPEFLDRNRTDVTGRLLSDYRETISDLLKENFTRQWTEWAHRNGSITRNQAHGSPANLIDTYAAVDIPECEGFGLSQFNIKGLRQDSLTRRNDSDLSMLKYASSAAHLTGRPFTSSETFTWLTEHFRTSLSQCKPDMDLMFAAGVNRMFFHGTPYSPKDAAWPGWLFYASINMSPTNTIWRDAPAFFSYITRCQSFLQMGQPDNDFLVYLPVYDIWHEKDGKNGARVIEFSIHNMAALAPEFIRAVNNILKCGYDADYVSDRFINSLECDNGLITTESGTKYKALIVPGAKKMPPEILKALMSLARKGATIIFLNNYPDDVPGLFQLKKRQKIMNRLQTVLPDKELRFTESVVHRFGKGHIVTGKDYAATLALCGNTTPEEMKTTHGLHVIRRKNDTGYHYFISSLQPKDVDGWTTLAVTAQCAALFDPMTGTCGEAMLRQQNGRTQVYLQLKSGQSVILRTYSEPCAFTRKWTYYEEQQGEISLDKGWKLRFLKSEPAINEVFDIDEPKSWTLLPDTLAKENAGTGVYSIDFNLPETDADSWLIDLGDVRESARVRINGQDAGTTWAVPFRLDIGAILRPGKNNMEVEVTNLPANRIAAYDRRGVKWRIFKDINMSSLSKKGSNYAHWEPMPSGLNGTVRLIPVKRKLF